MTNESSQPSNESGSAIADVLGGIGGGTLVGGLTYNHMANRKLAEALAADAAVNKAGEEVPEKSGLKKVNARLAKLDKEKVRAEIPSQKRLEQFEDALGHLQKAESLVFEQVGEKNFKAHATFSEAHLKNLSAEEIARHGIKEGKLIVEGIAMLPEGHALDTDTKKTAPLDIAGIRSLFSGSEDATAVSWHNQVMEAAEKAERPIIEKETIRAIRKVGGFGWSWGNLTGKGQAAVIGATLAGVAAGAMVVHTLFGGKNTQEAQASRASIPQGFGI